MARGYLLNPSTGLYEYGGRGLSTGGPWTPLAYGASTIWYEADRQTTTDSPSTIIDQGASGRVLTLQGTTNLIIAPKHFEMDGRRAFRSRRDQLQRGRDVAGDAATFWGAYTHTGAFTTMGCVRILGDTTQYIAATYTSSTSNEIGWALRYNGSTERFELVKVSTFAGGAVHINPTAAPAAGRGTGPVGGTGTTSGRFKIGDTVFYSVRDTRNGAWSATFYRPPRFNGDTSDSETITGTTENVATGNAPAGMTLGATTQGSPADTVCASMTLSSMVFVQRFITDAERDLYFIYLAKYAPRFIDYSSGPYAGVTQLSGTVRVGVLTDSRSATGATTLGVDDMRSKLAANAAGYPSFTHTRTGPINDASGNHFSRAGYRTQRIDGTKQGHLYGGSGVDATTINNFEALVDTVDIWHVLIGTNDLNALEVDRVLYDDVYSMYQLLTYINTRRMASAGVPARIALYTETDRGTNPPTAPAPRFNRIIRNRAYHPLVRTCRADGMVIVLSNLAGTIVPATQMGDFNHLNDAGHTVFATEAWREERWLAGYAAA